VTKVTYERETCSRCGGTGHYSYNQINGTTCFGCNGKGEKLTKRGRAASDFALSLVAKTADEIAVGDVVLYNGKGQITALSVEPCDLGYARMDKETGEYVKVMGIEVTGPKHSYKFHLSDKVRLPFTEEMIQEVIAYQDNLTKAGKPRKRRVAS